MRWDYRSGTGPDRFEGLSLILWIEHEPVAVDHLAVLDDGHVNARAALGVNQLDGLRHRVGIFPAVATVFLVRSSAPELDHHSTCKCSGGFRLLMAETVRFKIQAIKAVIFESSNVKSCASGPCLACGARV